jgi:hypothetical protein
MVIRDNGLKSTKRVLGSRISKYTQWPNENTINDLQNTTQIEEYESKKTTTTKPGMNSNTPEG